MSYYKCGIFKMAKDKEKNNEKDRVGWESPKKAIDSLRDFADSIGGNYGDQAGGALLIWKYLPANMRENIVQASQGRAEIDEEKYKKFFETWEI